MAKKVMTEKTSVCQCCKHQYGIDKFYQKPTEDPILKTNVLPYCERCIEKIPQLYLNEGKTLQEAIWLTCAKLDIPYIEKVFTAMKATVDGYIEKNENKTYLDYDLFKHYYHSLWGYKSLMTDGCVWEDFSSSDIPQQTLEEQEEEKQILEEYEKLKLDWGEQDDLENYKYLVYLYNRYTQNIQIVNPQQEDLYKDLCLARLEKRKIEEGKSDGSIDKIQPRILTLMSKLKIDNFENKKASSLSEQCLIGEIAKVEKYTVADYWKDKKKYVDLNGIRKYEEDCVLRPTLNSLVDNRNFDLDLEDLEKYRGITVPYD